MKRALTAILLGASLIGLLGGCASSRVVESEVTSFSSWTPAPPAPGASYRFERLLSQQQQGDAPQARLERLAQLALAKVGLQHNPQAASFSVQVSASSLAVLRSGWDSGYYPYGGPNIFLGGGSGGGGSNIGFGFGFPLGGMETPTYRREVSLVMRELRSNATVYETRALSEEPWRDTDPVLSAMLDAALRGFPVPPGGPRRVSVELPR